VAPQRRRRAFTLVELLIVLLILLFLFGMVATLLGNTALGNSQVRASAYQLAAVLGKARQMAMDHRGVYGVSFNIENAPGSSGSIINNRSGGHWYRIIGPHDPSWLGGWSGVGGYNLPYLFDRGSWAAWAWPPPTTGVNDVELGPWLNTIQNDFIGEKYYLPKGQARFVALLDQDNGDNNTPGARFYTTYPRPWFGDFVKGPGDAKPRLYCWGGYDPGFIDSNPGGGQISRPSSVNYSGFYYQGDDPPIVGCVNPRDRYIIDRPGGTDTVLDAQGSMKVTGEGYQLFAQGQTRPLVNGNWLDCVVLFNPDGTATMADWMGMRHQYGKSGDASIYDTPNYWNDNWNFNLMQLGPGDMCNYSRGSGPYDSRYEVSSYASVTGTHYFTIGKDMPDDTVQYPSAQAALNALMPLYRVGVSKLGEITVQKVTTTLPSNKTLDSKWAAPIWSNYNIGYIGYWDNVALSATGQRLVPTESVVTAQMMASQQWWMNP
jgi:prepilin-type N-terminal cleavage/methylation domain-containing protein